MGQKGGNLARTKRWWASESAQVLQYDVLGWMVLLNARIVFPHPHTFNQRGCSGWSSWKLLATKLSCRTENQEEGVDKVSQTPAGCQALGAASASTCAMGALQEPGLGKGLADRPHVALLLCFLCIHLWVSWTALLFDRNCFWCTRSSLCPQLDLEDLCKCLMQQD